NGWAGEVTLAPAARLPVRDAEPEALAELLTDQGVPEPGATVFGSAAERAGLRRRLSLPLRDLVAAPGFGGGLRGDIEPSHLAVTVPAPEPDEGQALLDVDATGLMRWHFGVEAAEGKEGGGRGGAGVDRGADGTQTFRVPVTQLDLGTAAE